MSLAAEFIDGGRGRILLVGHKPHDGAKRALIVVPAVAEEMNKSRRLIRDTGAELEKHGVWTIVPDLLGTGDSEGAFEDARWSDWVENIRRTVDWARDHGVETFDLLLVRLGAALFVEAEQRLDTAFERAVAWQPIGKGSDALKQLLRTKIMAIRMTGGSAPSLESLSEKLLGGTEPMELSGYCVSPELAKSIHAATFAAPYTTTVANGLILDLSPAAAESPPATSDPPEEESAWKRRKLAAERFWLATEPRPSPALVAATVGFLTG